MMKNLIIALLSGETVQSSEIIIFFSGLVVFLLFRLYWIRSKNQKSSQVKKSEDFEEQERQWIEKRKHKRVQWSFPIALSFEEDNPFLAMVKNISLNGAFAMCGDVDFLRAVNGQSQFKFNFSSKDPNFPIQGKAEVVRIGSNRGFGLKFFDLDHDRTSHLHNLA